MCIMITSCLMALIVATDRPENTRSSEPIAVSPQVPQSVTNDPQWGYSIDHGIVTIRYVNHSGNAVKEERPLPSVQGQDYLKDLKHNLDILIPSLQFIMAEYRAARDFWKKVARPLPYLEILTGSSCVTGLGAFLANNNSQNDQNAIIFSTITGGITVIIELTRRIKNTSDTSAQEELVKTTEKFVFIVKRLQEKPENAAIVSLALRAIDDVCGYTEEQYKNKMPKLWEAGMEAMLFPSRSCLLASNTTAVTVQPSQNVGGTN